MTRRSCIANQSTLRIVSVDRHRIGIHIFALFSESYTENYIQNTNIQKNYAHLSFARKLSYTRGSSYGRKLIVIQTGSIEILDIKLR